MDIEIFPYRFLSADTTEKMLNSIESLDDVKRTVIHGPRLPPDDPDLLPQYKERRNITVCGKPIELKVRTGRILVELSTESALDEIEKICDENLDMILIHQEMNILEDIKQLVMLLSMELVKMIFQTS